MGGALETLARWRDFAGRSRRTEFWMYVLWSNAAVFVAFLVYALLVAISGGEGTIFHLIFGVIFVLFWFCVAITSFSVAIRRLHDAGFSGWWILLAFLPPLNMVLLIFFILDSQTGENRFGPNPKFDG